MPGIFFSVMKKTGHIYSPVIPIGGKLNRVCITDKNEINLFLEVRSMSKHITYYTILWRRESSGDPAAPGLNRFQVSSSATQSTDKSDTPCAPAN